MECIECSPDVRFGARPNEREMQPQQVLEVVNQAII